MLRTLVLALSLLALPLAAQEMPKPGKEHQKLAACVGTWDAVIETPGEDGKMAKSKGFDVRRAGPGGFWVVNDFEGEMTGMKFTGHGVAGYDMTKGKYVQSWTDSMSPTLMVFEGNFDKDGKVLTMTCTADMGGQKMVMRSTTTLVDANTEVFEMFMTQDGKEMPMLKITYTRRAEKAGAAPAKK